jgi:hypothetical protein
MRFPTGATCRGSLTSVQNDGLSGSCGSHRVSIAWTIDATRHVAGRLRLS